MKKVILLFFLFSLCTTGFCNKIKTLTFNKFISLVLKKNLNIKSYNLKKNIYKYSIDKYISEFDTNFKLKLDKSYSKEFTGSELQSATSTYYISKNKNWDISLDKKFYLGTIASLSFSNNRFESNSNWSILNPSYSSLFELNITQPILKGAGISINKSEIIKAENILKATEYDIKNYINNTILNAAYKYFNLLYAYKNYQARVESLELAKDILNIDKKKLSAGLTSKDTIKQSEAEVASRKEDVIKAYQTLLNISDELKKYYNDIRADYIIKPDYIIEIKQLDVSLNNCINSALNNRYEIKKINQEIKNAEIDIKKTKNDILPELNLNLYGGLSGKGENYSDDIERMKNTCQALRIVNNFA
jgi:outer membrane protein TolC